MTAARTLLEAGAFVALAVLLHLGWFYLWPENAHGGPGTAGGASDMTLIGASAEMVALVEDWDVAPEMAPEPALPTTTKPLSPAAVQQAEAPAPVSQSFSPVADLNKPQAPEAPQLDPAMTAERGFADTPSPENLSLAPAKPTVLQWPETLTAVLPPQSSRLRVKQPGLTAPTALQAPPVVSQPELTPPADVNTHAVKKSPTPRAKPTPPARTARVQTMKAPAKPVAPAEPKALEKSPPTQTKTTAATADGAADQTAVAALKADDGGSSTNITGADGAARRASLARTWGRTIRSEVERNKRHPRNARLSGKVIIAITVERGGHLLDADIRQASGSRQLDQAALRAVQAAAPYQKAPTDLTGERFDFLLPVTFKR